MNIVERFLHYVSIDTMANERSFSTPSSANQLILAKELVVELTGLGLSNVFLNEYGIVRGTLEGTGKKRVALIAHLDTSPDAGSQNIVTRIISNYDGEDIKLYNNETLSVANGEVFERQKGHSLIVTDGKTLLGGDDKAGIAIIMDSLRTIIDEKKEHINIEIIFTSDEEIGRGTDNVDVKAVNADYAITVDGGTPHEINIENFNASEAFVEVNGVSIHPGSATGKMINASNLATLFHSKVPEFRPENTSLRTGFYHLTAVSGSCEEAQLHYILRDHDLNKLADKEKIMCSIASDINRMYGKELVSVKIKRNYYNMKEELTAHPAVIKRLEEVYNKLNIPFVYSPIRGGTDGARLTFMGLPCPNIGTGDYNCHGRHEYVDIDEMKLMSKIVQEFIQE